MPLRKNPLLLTAGILAFFALPLLRASAWPQSPPEGTSPRSFDTVPADNTLPEKTVPRGDASGKTREPELVGFMLTGSNDYQKLSIRDMGILRIDGKRFLPLLRMLNALDLKVTSKRLEVPEPGRTTEKRILRLQPDGSTEVDLDLSSRRMEIDGKVTPVDVVEEVSVFTHEPEIFLPQEVIARIFSMEITWNEQEYAFEARTNLPLGIWGLKKRFWTPVQETPTNLPELLPPAFPRKTGLDLMEVRGRARVSLDGKFRLTEGLDSLQETFWGKLLGGSYKLRFSEPDIAVGEMATRLNGRSPVALDLVEWVHRFPNHEIVLGDSNFGLDELTFPYVKMTGIRSNGISGATEEERVKDPSSRGLQVSFVQPMVFDGFAPRGSKVELVINDRTIDTQQAIGDRGTATGEGRYRFEGIILPPGRLSEVLINITDPNGVVTHIRQYVQGSSQLLPEGRFAYMGGAGTNRDSTTWHTSGIFSGGRALYGVTDRFTIGGVLGTQKSYYPRLNPSSDPDSREVPKTSYHLGGNLFWQPIPHALLSGDASFSKITDDPTRGVIRGVAYKAKGAFYPTTDMELNSQFFYFGPDFFDGNSTTLFDREGYVFNGRWQPFPKWSMTGAYGQVRDNVKRDPSDNTILAAFQNLEVATSAIPRTTLISGFYRLSSNTGESTKTFPYLRLSSSPLHKLYVEGSVSGGKSPNLVGNPRFLTGLSVPGLALYEQPARTATLRTELINRNSLGFTYWESGDRKRITATHTYSGISEKRLGIRTEVGYDYNFFNGRSPFLENRTEYQLDRFRNKTVELWTRYSFEQWEFSLSFNFNELFSFPRWSPTRVNKYMVNPEIGGVHGKVFLDYNANGRMDPGEPGVEDVKVVAGSKFAITDKYGYFFLPAFDQGEVRVFIDLNSVPAIYTPTHGIQTVHLQMGNMTEINFGITPGISITGLVTWRDSRNAEKPLPGVRVFVTDAAGREIGTDSLTAGDGTYYIGNLKPGKYTVKVDPGSVLKGYIVSDPVRAIEISPAKEPQEVTLPPFQATLR